MAYSQIRPASTGADLLIRPEKVGLGRALARGGTQAGEAAGRAGHVLAI